MSKPRILLSIAILSALLLVRTGQSSDFAFRDIILPEYMKTTSSILVLGDSLKSPSGITRLYAVKRMAQLKDPQAVPLLKEAISKEPPVVGIDSNLGLRYYAIIAIGRVGGPTAEAYLYGLTEDFRKANPSPGVRGGLDHIETVYAVFIGLAELGTERCREFLYRTYSNPDIEGNFRAGAYAAYKRIILKDARFASPRDSLNYILDELRKTVVTNNYVSPGVMSTEFIETNGLKELIYEYGHDHPNLLEDYKNDLALDDNFILKLDTIILNIRSGLEREQKHIELREKGWR